MGQLLRIALILLVIWLAYRGLRQLFKGRHHVTEKDSSGIPIRMLPCSHCGVYVPQTQALHHGEKAYCCQAHLPPEARSRY